MKSPSMSCDGGEVFNRAVQQCGDLYPNARDGLIKVFHQFSVFHQSHLLPTYIPSDQDLAGLRCAAARAQKHPRAADFRYVTQAAV